MMKKLTKAKLLLAIVLAFMAFSCNDKQLLEEQTSNILNFENENELITILDELKNGALENRENITKLENLNSMLDEFDLIYLMEDEKDYNSFLIKNNHFLNITEIQMDADSTADKICSLKLNFILASIVNTDGLLTVNNNEYNLLDSTDLVAFTNLLTDYTPIANDSLLKSRIVSIPDYLPILIPMNANFRFPTIYPTKYFKTTISGRSVIVQLWKGYCPGIWGYAGGVGAEVGLYYPVRWTKKLWFPDYKNPKGIYYNLRVKSTGKSVLTASDYTWWLNRWRKDYIGLPLKGDSYTLYYNINGTSRTW